MGRLTAVPSPVTALSTTDIQTYGLFFQGAAIVASAIGLGLTLWTSRNIARRRATLDLLLMEQTDEAVIAQRRIYITARNSGALLTWAPKNQAETPEARAINATLNLYEFVAIGIKESTLDGDLYKRGYRTTLVKDWIALKPFVMEMRRLHDHPTFFCEYEELAKNWATPTEKPNV